MVFQRRGQHGNPADYFAREMAQYERGFGDPGAEFWLGLDKLATLTRDGGAELMVKLETFEVTMLESSVFHCPFLQAFLRLYN